MGRGWCVVLRRRGYDEGMEIDHIFMFVEPDGPELAALQQWGLHETYRRQHPGQGTANACFAFDNLFVELLWVTDEAEIRSSVVQRTRLWERSQWRALGTCPFGLAFRGDMAALGVSTWTYRPPYLAGVLPPETGIAVATDSDDPMQPMLFAFPGSTAPRHWPASRQGQLQHAAGWGDVSAVSLCVSTAWEPCHALRVLAEVTGLALNHRDGEWFQMTATLNPRSSGQEVGRLNLPVLRGG